MISDKICFKKIKIIFGLLLVLVFNLRIINMNFTHSPVVRVSGGLMDVSFHSSNEINYSCAPANLTGVIVDDDEYIIPAINVSVNHFIDEWERVFNKSLPLIRLSWSDIDSKYNYTDPAIFNGSIIVGSIRDEIGYSWIDVSEENITVLTRWENGTFGAGWAIYGGSTKALVQALAFYGSTLDTVDAWIEPRVVSPRFPFLLGNYEGLGEGVTRLLEESLVRFESKLQQMVRRGYSAVEMFVQYEKFSNISLPGYEEPNHEDDYSRYIDLIKKYIDMAANYSIEIYFNTDELSLTEAQYNWLISNLDYNGPAAKSDYPDHLNTNAPGLWRYWQAKYDAIVESLETILTPENKAGFGGFYFRTADQSNPYPYRFDILPTNNTAFQRFINITTDAAARLGAKVIHRMWRLGDEENVFNNATLARELLDPIKATNLILRCKETWNDHWYNHPPNPVIGTSHHKWIIGWYVGAAMPDYKGKYFDDLFNESGWLENPNVIGFDNGFLATSSFNRLDLQPFQSANAHYLFVKRWHPEWNGNQTLRKYFHQVGITDENAIISL
ncbi:MAG: hypothetical protein ACTSXP_03575, partial [Promethearchaeota archaeon]